MSAIHEVPWNKVFEFAWRILVFIVAIAIIVDRIDQLDPLGGRGGLATNQ